jgi:hypothetical protein
VQAESISHVQGVFMFDYELKNRVRLKMETPLMVDYGAGVPGRSLPPSLPPSLCLSVGRSVSRCLSVSRSVCLSGSFFSVPCSCRGERGKKAKEAPNQAAQGRPTRRRPCGRLEAAGWRRQVGGGGHGGRRACCSAWRRAPCGSSANHWARCDSLGALRPRRLT